ncbi:hypothetical protein, partial [Pseudomonas sp. RTS4]
QRQIDLITNAENTHTMQRAYDVAYGYLLALRDEGLIDSSEFSALDAQANEAGNAWVENGLLSEDLLCLAEDGSKCWLADDQANR